MDTVIVEKSQSKSLGKKKSFFHCTRFVRSYAVVIIIRLECHTFLFIFFFITVMRMPLGIRYVVSGPTVFTYVKKKKKKPGTYDTIVVLSRMARGCFSAHVYHGHVSLL